MFQCDQRRVGVVADVELIEGERPVEANQRLRLRLHEMHVHISRQRPVRNFDRQLHRRVADVLRDIEAMQFQVNHRVASRLERLGHAGDPQRAAVDHHLQQRLHEHVHVGRQVRDKRHVELNLLDLVLLAEQLIVDRYLAAVELDVGDGEFHRRARRGRLRFGGRRRALEQIGKIEFLLRLAHYMDRGLVDHHFADHRRKPEQRSPRNLHRQMPEIDKRFLRSVALAKVQLVEVKLQPIKIEADFAYGHLAMDTAGDGAGQHVAQDRRDRNVCREAQEQDHGDDDHADFAHAPRTAQLLRARHPRLRGMKRRPQTFDRSAEKVPHQTEPPDAASVSRRQPIVNSGKHPRCSYRLWIPSQRRRSTTIGRRLFRSAYA